MAHSDTGRSITSSLSDYHTYTVYMHGLLPDGTRVTYTEENEGYGVFGGKDYFVLLSEMNPPSSAKNLTVC